MLVHTTLYGSTNSLGQGYASETRHEYVPVGSASAIHGLRRFHKRIPAQSSPIQCVILLCRNERKLHLEEGFSLKMEGTSAARDCRRELQGRTRACPRNLQGEARLHQASTNPAPAMPRNQMKDEPTQAKE